MREILLARIRNPIFVQACLKEKVPGNIKNTTEITGILVPDPGEQNLSIGRNNFRLMLDSAIPSIYKLNTFFIGSNIYSLCSFSDSYYTSHLYNMYPSNLVKLQNSYKFTKLKTTTMQVLHVRKFTGHKYWSPRNVFYQNCLLYTCLVLYT